MAGKKRVPGRIKTHKEVKPQGFTKQQWITIGICAAAIVLLLVGYFVLRDMFDGSLKVQDGVVQAEDNWIFANTGTTSKPKYFKLGEIETPEGFTKKIEHYMTDENVPTYFFYPEGDSPVESISIIPAAGAAKDMADKVSGSYGSFYTNAVSGEVSERALGGLTGWGFTITYDAAPSASTEDTESTETATPGRIVNVYFDASHDQSILISATATAADAASVPDEATLMEIIKSFAENLTIDGTTKE